MSTHQKGPPPLAGFLTYDHGGNDDEPAIACPA